MGGESRIPRTLPAPKSTINKINVYKDVSLRLSVEEKKLLVPLVAAAVANHLPVRPFTSNGSAAIKNAVEAVEAANIKLLVCIDSWGACALLSRKLSNIRSSDPLPGEVSGAHSGGLSSASHPAPPASLPSAAAPVDILPLSCLHPTTPAGAPPDGALLPSTAALAAGTSPMVNAPVPSVGCALPPAPASAAVPPSEEDFFRSLA